MSECSGPNCTHPSHEMDVQKHKQLQQHVTSPRPQKQLTRNQRKAKRRKGILGY